MSRFKWIRALSIAGLLWLPLNAYASFIEATMGTAVVNDATATYHNPAALTLLKNPQVIALGSVAYFDSKFTGEVIQTPTGLTQSGSSSSSTHYYIPSFYVAMPATSRVSIGVAVLYNYFNKDLDDNSILRYVQSGNKVQDLDVLPAIGVKINDVLSLGVGLIISRANFVLNPIVGFPTLDVPDSQSRNTSSGTSFGGDAGFLLTLSPTTLLGFNYRSAVTYRLSGTSTFEGTPSISSNQYHFVFWTPARSVVSISHLFTPKIGMIGTVQRIQSSIIRNVTLHNVATEIGTTPVIVPNATVPFYLNNSWVFTLGGNYRFHPKWVIRAAGTFLQASGNSSYQISNGNSIVAGASLGYEINKNFVIDGSYAHMFINDQPIHIASAKNTITGVNQASRDGVSVKLTVNL